MGGMDGQQIKDEACRFPYLLGQNLCQT